MAGIKSTVCNEMALQLWQWSCGRNIWLSACHLAGTSNKVGDGVSRNFDGSTEWPFNMRVFEDVSSKRGPFQIDLFASGSNQKVPSYVSWKPDPGAKRECFPDDWVENVSILVSICRAPQFLRQKNHEIKTLGVAKASLNYDRALSSSKRDLKGTEAFERGQESSDGLAN